MTYGGLWRGIVVKNDDSATDTPFLGRIQVSIPEVYGTPVDNEALPWAWPCSIMGGGLYDTDAEKSVSKGEVSDKLIASGLTAIPAVGATVWVMFEHGDPQVPVYLGTWNGRRQELPMVAQSSGSTKYPNIFSLKMPWGKDIYLRVVDDSMLEISFGSMKVQMSAGQMSLLADTESIVVQSNTGHVVLSGATVTVSALTSATVRAGTYKLDAQGKSVVDVAGDVVIQASQNSRIFTEKTARLQAGEQGAIHAQAPTTSGFEKHTPVNMKQG